MVEVYLMKIKLCLYPKDKLFQEFSFSRGDTVGRKVHNKMWDFIDLHLIGIVIQKTKELFNVSTTDECRLWKCCLANKCDLLINIDQTLSGASVNEKMVTITILIDYLVFVFSIIAKQLINLILSTIWTLSLVYYLLDLNVRSKKSWWQLAKKISLEYIVCVFTYWWHYSMVIWCIWYCR